jgi:hypothetical protein
MGLCSEVSTRFVNRTGAFVAQSRRNVTLRPTARMAAESVDSRQRKESFAFCPRINIRPDQSVAAKPTLRLADE